MGGDDTPPDQARKFLGLRGACGSQGHMRCPDVWAPSGEIPRGFCSARLSASLRAGGQPGPHPDGLHLCRRGFSPDPHHLLKIWVSPRTPSLIAPFFQFARRFQESMTKLLSIEKIPQWQPAFFKLTLSLHLRKRDSQWWRASLGDTRPGLQFCSLTDQSWDFGRSWLWASLLPILKLE